MEFLGSQNHLINSNSNRQIITTSLLLLPRQRQQMVYEFLILTYFVGETLLISIKVIIIIKVHHRLHHNNNNKVEDLLHIRCREIMAMGEEDEILYLLILHIIIITSNDGLTSAHLKLPVLGTDCWEENYL